MQQNTIIKSIMLLLYKLGLSPGLMKEKLWSLKWMYLGDHVDYLDRTEFVERMKDYEKDECSTCYFIRFKQDN